MLTTVTYDHRCTDSPNTECLHWLIAGESITRNAYNWASDSYWTSVTWQWVAQVLCS